MPDRVAAVLMTSDWRVLAVRHRHPDGAEYRTLPGGTVRETDPDHDGALRRVLRALLRCAVEVGPLVCVVRTGEQDEYVFAAWAEDGGDLPGPDPAEAEPAPGAFVWDHVVYDKSAIYAAGFVPHQVTYFLAGHCHHGHDPRRLPDVRSRRPSVRRHHGPDTSGRPPR
ncbi:hypothetical protein [Actinomadura sp. HBU206391]|uniref:hypothetical protein n=1 Tax=Actinomadura sp. HBU206391 TaxID=2731692 RepID=UPI00164EE5C6|nr:hypothetical protein [Actinomadura sp. HBU206391]MBC6456507.1 hypothetical protein [Actinomadura sp. HBU206391]